MLNYIHYFNSYTNCRCNYFLIAMPIILLLNILHKKKIEYNKYICKLLRQQYLFNRNIINSFIDYNEGI